MKTADQQLAPDGAALQPLRSRLLDLAFQEIYQNGFLGLRVDRLIEKAGSTKGAFYHHFPSKNALGYAVVDEVLTDLADTVWGRHLAEFADPLEGIEASARFAMARLGPQCLQLGCPFNNLAQEMSAVDDGFRDRISQIFTGIVGNIADALRRGRAAGHVDPDIDIETTANFIFAALEGSLGLVKAMGAEKALDISMKGLHVYLESLRPKRRA